MNRLILIAMVVLATSSLMLAADDTAVTLQNSYHVWVPEPELATAIACQNNDFGCEHPDDPGKHKKVPLPIKVRDAIRGLTSQTFENELYEGTTKFADLFGYIYRITIPDNNNLHLYVYQLKRIPWLSSRYYNIILILHDTTKDKVSSKPISLATDFQSYCLSPWIRFQDVLGDSKDEILILTGEHNGNVYNCMHQHIFQIEPGTDLKKLGTIKTGIWSPHLIYSETEKRIQGYLLRTITKTNYNHFTTIVSLSENKQLQGEIILGIEVYELDQNNTLKRNAVNIKGKTEDETTGYNDTLMDSWYF